MTSHYTNIISIACLFLCLFIASARSSLIRQITDGFNKSQQRMQSSEEKGCPPSTYSIKNTDYSETGATISSSIQPNEVFDINGKILYGFTWTLRRFSKLLEERYQSATYFAGRRKWSLNVLPNGAPARGTLGLSLYLVLDKSEILKPSQRIVVTAKLRVLNQRQSNTFERTFSHPYSVPGADIGFDNIVSQADLRDPSKGFVVEDSLQVQVEFVRISETSCSQIYVTEECV